jgi:hypothetical protein
MQRHRMKIPHPVQAFHVHTQKIINHWDSIDCYTPLQVRAMATLGTLLHIGQPLLLVHLIYSASPWSPSIAMPQFTTVQRRPLYVLLVVGVPPPLQSTTRTRLCSSNWSVPLWWLPHMSGCRANYLLNGLITHFVFCANS